MTSFCFPSAIRRDTLATRSTDGDTAPVPTPFYRVRRRPQLAAHARALPARGPRRREPAGRRLRARRQPHVELRSVAARLAAVARAAAVLHGQGGALQPDSRTAVARRRRVSRAARRAGHRGHGGLGQALPRGEDRRDVPRRDAAIEGHRQEVRAPAADGCRPHRACGEGAARARRDRRHRPHVAAAEAQGRLRAAGADGRSRRHDAARRVPRGHRAAHERHLRAL